MVAKRLVVTEELEDDYPEEHPQQQQEIAEIVHESGSRITRKRLLLGAGAATGGALGPGSADSCAVAGSFWDTRPLDETPWRRGVRLVDVDGVPLTAADLEQQTFYTGFPEGANFEDIASPLVDHPARPQQARAARRARRLGAERDPRLLEDLHTRRLRDRAVSQADVPGARAQQRARLPVPLLDLRSVHGRDGYLRSGRSPAAAAAADDRCRRLPARRGELLGPGGAELVGRERATGLSNGRQTSVLDPVRFIDERTAAAPQMRKLMRYLFPDHWSFLLGEVALYAFLVLIATGIYLALFFDPSTAQTVYHGPYAPLDGQSMSMAYDRCWTSRLATRPGC